MKVTEAWHLKDTYGKADWPTMQTLDSSIYFFNDKISVIIYKK